MALADEIQKMYEDKYRFKNRESLNSKLKKHFEELPQKLEENQRAMDKTMAGMYETDVLGRPNPNYYPEAMQEFTQNYMPSVMGSFLPSTKLKPNPEVGTRFVREYLGGLAEKKPVKIEDLKGSSALIMPWDSSSRNYAIKSISGEALPTNIITHGGQDYARDLEHIKKGVGGASNLGIAKRIADRDAQARIENLAQGGTGNIVHFPTTMGEGDMNFSVMPTEAVLGILDARSPSKQWMKELNESIRNYTVPKKTANGYTTIQPFKGFQGIDTEAGRMQLYSGEGIDSTAGELRKAFVDRTAGLKSNQQYLGFNAEDLTNALKDPSLAGVPKGYIGNTVLQTGETGMHLKPSQNATYSTDFTSDYLGSLGTNVPVEAIFPKTFGSIEEQMAGKKGDIRNMTLGALEKRKSGVSEYIDQQAIDNYYNYLESPEYQKRISAHENRFNSPIDTGLE